MVLAGSAGVVAVRRPLPPTRGRLTAAGLQREVRVVRDRWGTAHVDAASMTDAAFAMGLVHAHERLWQLDYHRRVGCGRIAEIAGPAATGADIFLRRVGLHRVAEEEAASLGGETAAMLDAYAAGVNSVIDGGRPLPLEFSLLHIRPEPWRAADSLVCMKLLALGLSLDWDGELRRLALLRTIGPERAALVDAVCRAADPSILAGTLRAAGSGGGDAALLFAEAARWLPTSTGACSAWAVAPKRTANGRPLLCNDPHLTPSMPSTWFGAHVRAAGDFESAGVTLPGLPFPLIGHNPRIAWGCAGPVADCQCLVIEEFDGVAGTRHRSDNAWEPTRMRRELIAVKGGSDVVEEVLVTRHGPVLERSHDPATGRWLGLALQWTALSPGAAAGALLQVQRARDWSGFRVALASSEGPSQTSVYADVDGHIGIFCNARVPVRHHRPSGLPIPGWTGDAVWDRFLSIEEVPQRFDPADGLVVAPDDRLGGQREARLTELLDANGVDADLMRSVQMDVLDPPAREVSGLLAAIHCDAPRAEAMRARLAAWDGEMRAAAIEPAIYEAFLLRLAEHALRPVLGDRWALAAGMGGDPPSGGSDHLLHRATPALLALWASGDEDLFEGATTWQQVATRALEDATADLRRSHGPSHRWRWGRLHHVVLAHPLARRAALRPLLNARPVHVGGNAGTVLATAHVPGRGFATRRAAPSWRMVLDVGEWDTGCTGIHQPGQSGHRASRHHHDLSRRWRENRQVPLGWGDDAFRGRRSLLLVPGAEA